MAAAVPSHPMKYRYLGNSGLLVSRLSFGSFINFNDDFGVDAAYSLMLRAFQGGVNFFDNAESYALGMAETLVGQTIKEGVETGAWTREDLAGPNDQGVSRKHLVEGAKASLKRMQLDYVDVIYCHRPEASTPIEETVRAMNHIINKGQAFYWGTSEWTSHDIIEACEIADRLGLIRPIVEQPQYHIFERSRVDYDYVNLYKKYKYGLTTWSPLAHGILSAKYTQGIPEQGSQLSGPEVVALALTLAWCIDQAEKLKVIAGQLGLSLLQRVELCAVPTAQPQGRASCGSDHNRARFKPNLSVVLHAIISVRSRARRTWLKRHNGSGD